MPRKFYFQMIFDATLIAGMLLVTARDFRNWKRYVEADDGPTE